MKANSSVQLCFPQQYWHIRGQRNCSPATVTYKGTMQLFPSRPATPITYAVGNDFCWFFMQWLAVMKDINVTERAVCCLRLAVSFPFLSVGQTVSMAASAFDGTFLPFTCSVSRFPQRQNHSKNFQASQGCPPPLFFYTMKVFKCAGTLYTEVDVCIFSNFFFSKTAYNAASGGQENPESLILKEWKLLFGDYFSFWDRYLFLY